MKSLFAFMCAAAFRMQCECKSKSERETAITENICAYICAVYTRQASTKKLVSRLILHVQQFTFFSLLLWTQAMAM